MLDPKLLRSSIDSVVAQIKKRGIEIDVDTFNKLEEQRKSLQVKMQELQNARNVRSKEVGRAKAEGKNMDEVMLSLKELSDELKSVEEQFAKKQVALDDFLARIPNITHESVPFGKSEEDNQVVRVWGEPKQFSFKPKDHVELGANQNWMDFETAAKLSGARFVVLRGPLARLQRALIQFMLDLHTREHGYQEIAVPYLANAECFYGVGQLPKMKDD